MSHLSCRKYNGTNKTYILLKEQLVLLLNNTKNTLLGNIYNNIKYIIIKSFVAVETSFGSP